MKKIVTAGITGVWIVFSLLSIAYSQEDKGDILRKQVQAEVAADSNDYTIGAEDILNINVWKEETLSRTVTVRMDGKISLPLIGDIQADGLTLLQLKEVLIEKLNEFVNVPDVSVLVTEANSMKVFVSGQVKTPGVYRLRSETTILQIIAMAGGFTDWANQKKIHVFRRENGREKRFIVNYKRIVSGKDLDSNIVLKRGDTIIVP